MSTVCVTDAELVARARQGDTAAFGELVDRHRAAAFRAALAVLGSPAEADEAAQDACVAAWRRLAGFRGDASFKTWLLTIAWRHAVSRRRRGLRWLRRDDSGWDHLPAPQPSPERAAAAAEEQRALVKEVRALPVKLRDALLLAQSGDYRYEDIAAICGVALGTIKWRVSEARRLVRKRMRERGYMDV